MGTWPTDLQKANGGESKGFSRARVLAHDPDVWLAESVVPLPVRAAAKPAAPEDDDEDDADEKAAKSLDPRFLALIEVPDDRDDWQHRLMLLKAAGYEPDDVEKWSSAGAKYEQGEVVNAWESWEPQESKSKAQGILLWMIRNGKSPVGGPYVLSSPMTRQDDLVVIRARYDALRGEEG